MRITRLRAAYFRGFRDRINIPLDSDLVILQGPNGSGKTTVAEAIEWLLFGSSQRQETQNLEAYEKRGALVAAQRPPESTTYVEVDIRTRTNRTHTLRRELITDGTDERHFLKIDGKEVEDFSRFGLDNADRFYPVVVQENLQHFIRSTGQQRRDQITRLLGLETLLDYEQQLDSAVKRLDGALPSSYRDASQKVATLGRSLKQQSVLPEVNSRWSDGSAQPGDWQLVRSFAAETLGKDASTSVEQLLKSASDQEEDAKKSVVDLSDQAPPEATFEFEEDAGRVVNTVIELREAVSTQVECQKQAYRQLDEALTTEHLLFLENGLDLVERPEDAQPHDCPFCAEPTITVEKYEQLKEKHDAGEDFLQAKQQVESITEEVKQAATDLERTYLDSAPSDLDARKYEELQELLHTTESLTTFRSSLRKLRSRVESLEELITHIREFSEEVQSKLAAPPSHDEVEAFFNDIPREIRDHLKELQKAVEEYRQSFAGLESDLEPVVSSQDRVKRLKSIRRLLQAEDDIYRVAKAEAIRSFLKRTRSDTREFIEDQTKKRISERAEDIVDWFDTLYGNEEDVLAFSGVESRGTTMRMWVNVLGDQRHAATHLSQSQLNCLGLSLHVVAGLSSNCPFNFVLFDDPIQSFDERLRGRFVDSAVPTLIDENDKQVIVFTHVEGFAQSLLYANAHRQPLVHHAKPLSPAGIEIDTGSWIGRALNDIRRRGRSSEDITRTVACQRMRPLGEHICKAVYQKKTRQHVPPEFENVTGPKVVDLLESVKGVADPDMSQLRELITWAAGAVHDDPTWSAPDTQRIAERADKLESIARSYNLPIDS